MKFYDSILDTNSCNIVLAELSKEETKKVFEDARKQPRNGNNEPDDTYVSGEVRYIFDKDTDSLDEVMVFPYYDEDGDLTCGDFIYAPDAFWDKENEARQYLKI